MLDTGTNRCVWPFRRTVRGYAAARQKRYQRCKARLVQDSLILVYMSNLHGLN